MDFSGFGDNTDPTRTPGNSSTPSNTPSTNVATTNVPDTQESQNVQAGPSVPPLAGATAQNPIDIDDPTWWGYHIRSPSDAYDETEDYGLGEEVADGPPPPGQEEELHAGEETAPTNATAGTSRRSDGRTNNRWSVEEEWDLLLAFLENQDEITRRTGQQGRSWYPFLHGVLRRRRPEWRHDSAAIKAKLHRLKDTWRRWKERGFNHSGGGRPRGLPAWYDVADEIWVERPAAVPPVLAGTGLPPAGATVPPQSATGAPPAHRRFPVIAVPPGPIASAPPRLPATNTTQTTTTRPTRPRAASQPANPAGTQGPPSTPYPLPPRQSYTPKRIQPRSSR
ncbi:unnamed protein product [Closterium sp. Yama58-4]|nr:unnamed protein product [Closterium sp. Yama58-4]